MFKYLADNVGKDGVEAPGVPPDIGGALHYDPNKKGKIWVWGLGTERATSGGKPRAIRKWRTFEPESLDFVMREQTTPSQPGYTGSREVKGSTPRPAGRVEDVGPDMPGEAPQQGPAVPPSPKRAEAELAQKEATFKEFLKQTEKDLDELYEQRKALLKRAQEEGPLDSREGPRVEKEMRRLNEEIDAKVRHVETYRLQLGDKVESDKWLKGWKYQDLTAGEKGAHREVLEKPLSRGAGLLERLRKAREARTAKAEKAHQARQKEASEAHQAKVEARAKFEEEMKARREAAKKEKVKREEATEARRPATNELLALTK